MDNITKDETFRIRVNEMLNREVTLPDNELVELYSTGTLRNKSKVRDIIIAAQVKKAMAGDNGSFVILRDTAGEKPVDEVKENRTVRIVMDERIKEYGE